MSLLKLMTATYSTKRLPSAVSGKGGVPTTHLQNVKFTPVMPIDVNEDVLNYTDAITGQVLRLWEIYAEAHSHTDGGVTVNQVPDIKGGDSVVIGSVDYSVRQVENWPATSATLAFIRVILQESL